MGFSSAVICIIIFMWRYLLKRYYLVIPVFLVLMISLFVLNKQTNGLMINRITAVLHMQKSEIALTDIQTNNDNVSLTYNGNQMYVTYNKDVDKNKIFSITDTNNQSIPYDYDTATLTYPVKDERFPGMVLGENQDNPGVFYISVDGKQYYFTNQYGDLTYYYINHKDKIDKMVTAPAAIFNDYESFASGRGYIWSRTIPLLKKYIILGAGPDTFTMAFPQQDYLGLDRNGFADNVLTKPHSLYLQIGVQTGVLSLIAFLVFYFMYFASSFKIYIKGRFNSFYAQVGVAIFIGTIAYMITGLTNDSSITTAPIFWTLIGIGIAVNYKAKPLILEEEAAIKAMKEKNNS
jgi:hypothetical protein